MVLNVHRNRKACCVWLNFNWNWLYWWVCDWNWPCWWSVTETDPAGVSVTETDPGGGSVTETDPGSGLWPKLTLLVGLWQKLTLPVVCDCNWHRRGSVTETDTAGASDEHEWLLILHLVRWCCTLLAVHTRSQCRSRASAPAALMQCHRTTLYWLDTTSRASQPVCLSCSQQCQCIADQVRRQ